MSEARPARAAHPLRGRLGAGVALATPFDAVGGIRWPFMAEHAKRLLGCGISAVATFGTTGEGASIDRRIRAEAFDRLAAHGLAPASLVQCVYGPAAHEAGQDIRRSIDAGCLAVLLVPPFYFKGVSDEGLYRWHAEVFDATGPSCRDVILYNIPSLTGATIGASLVARLRDAFPDIVAGVKDSGGDWHHTASLLAEHRDLAILVGHEGHLAQAVRRGASGAISGVANIAPRMVADLAAGKENPLVDWLIERLLAMPVVPALKSVLAAQSGDESWSRVRSPLEEIDRPADLAVCAEIAVRLRGNGDVSS